MTKRRLPSLTMRFSVSCLMLVLTLTGCGGRKVTFIQPGIGVRNAETIRMKVWAPDEKGELTVRADADVPEGAVIVLPKANIKAATDVSAPAQ